MKLPDRMRDPDHFDLIVLGAGSAGYAAARVAATELRARVALVDRGPLGGLCILAGCMPSKALIQSGRAAHAVRTAAEFGIRVEGFQADFAAVMARKRRLIGGFARYRQESIEALPNTEVIEGAAHFVGPDQLMVGERRLQADRFVLATGSAPSLPPIPGLAEAGYMVSDQALALEALPTSLLVVGGGVIALELGQFFARLGTQVTIVEVAERLMAREDPDVSEVITARLRREGVTILTGVRPIHAARRGDTRVLRVQLPDGAATDLAAEHMLVATGRMPNVAGLGLEAAGVAFEGRTMKLNRCLQTTNPAIFAAGDVTGLSYLVHVAIAEGELAARNALLGCPPKPVAPHLYVSAAFTEPQIARVGLSEAEAKRLGRPVLVGRYDFADHGKAEVLGETDGFVKMIADPFEGEIVGATVVGPEGAELIHEVAAAITLRATVDQFLQIPHVHPTLAEIWTYPAESLLAQMRALPRDLGLPAGYGDAQDSSCTLGKEPG